MSEENKIDLSAPEVQNAIKEAVDSELSGLKAKNGQLLSEVKELKKGQTVDVNEHDRVVSENENLQAELSKLNKKYTVDIEKLTKSYETEKGYSEKLIISNSLNDSLVSNDIGKQFVPAVKAMLASQVVIEKDGENKVAKIDGKSVSEYVKNWAGSDEGKFFVNAPANGGGNANGGTDGAGGQKTMTRSEWDSKQASGKHQECSDFVSKGGKIVDS